MNFGFNEVDVLYRAMATAGLPIEDDRAFREDMENLASMLMYDAVGKTALEDADLWALKQLIQQDIHTLLHRTSVSELSAHLGIPKNAMPAIREHFSQAIARLSEVRPNAHAMPFGPVWYDYITFDVQDAFHALLDAPGKRSARWRRCYGMIQDTDGTLWEAASLLKEWAFDLALAGRTATLDHEISGASPAVELLLQALRQHKDKVLMTPVTGSSEKEHALIEEYLKLLDQTIMYLEQVYPDVQPLLD